jgi:hypothetical protein
MMNECLLSNACVHVAPCVINNPINERLPYHNLLPPPQQSQTQTSSSAEEPGRDLVAEIEKILLVTYQVYLHLFVRWMSM